MATTKAAETTSGVTTSWLPITSAYPSIPGCESSFFSVVPSTLAGWDPGYGLFAQNGLACQPPEVTSWWDAQHQGVDVQKTQYSLGPVTCPQAYTTAQTSVKASGSTFVACCPSSYTFARSLDVGNTGQCFSQLIPGQVVRFATLKGSSAAFSTTTMQASSVVYGIPVNGWVFTSATSSRSTSGATRTTSPSEGASSAPSPTGSAFVSDSPSLSTGAKVGLGVGIPIAVIGLAALLAVFLLRRRKKTPKSEAEMEGNGPPTYYAKVAPEIPTTAIPAQQAVRSPVELQTEYNTVVELPASERRI